MGRVSVQCVSTPEILFQNQITLFVKPKGRDVNTAGELRGGPDQSVWTEIEDLFVRLGKNIKRKDDMNMIISIGSLAAPYSK